MSHLLAIGLVLSNVLFHQLPAIAADECGFGNTQTYLSEDSDTYDEDDEYIEDIYDCVQSTWTFENFNDGFSKYFSVYIEPDNDDVTNTGSDTVQIYCDKKKIQIYVWVEYADSIGWSGTGQFRFDGSPPKKFSYFLQKDFDGITLKDSKTFMQSLVKSKTKFSFKIPTVNGYEVLVYPKANIIDYRSRFAKAGCKF